MKYKVYFRGEYKYFKLWIDAEAFCKRHGIDVERIQIVVSD